MQDRPSAPDLMDAIADFLMKDVMPLVKEQDAVAYKTLVSWNMLGVMARELREGEGHVNEELKRLHDLIADTGGNSPRTQLDKQRQVRELNVRLAEKIKTEKIADPASPAWKHVKQTLIENLAVSNPRFNTDS